jgi:hypoxanthine-guanine phosphoribosyltransferase
LQIPIRVDYHGFKISEEIVVGYGLDYCELTDVYQLKK